MANDLESLRSYYQQILGRIETALGVPPSVALSSEASRIERIIATAEGLNAKTTAERMLHAELLSRQHFDTPPHGAPASPEIGRAVALLDRIRSRVADPENWEAMEEPGFFVFSGPADYVRAEIDKGLREVRGENASPETLVELIENMTKLGALDPMLAQPSTQTTVAQPVAQRRVPVTPPPSQPIGDRVGLLQQTLGEATSSIMQEVQRLGTLNNLG